MLRGPAAGHARLRRRRREDKYAAHLAAVTQSPDPPQQQRRRDNQANRRAVGPLMTNHRGIASQPLKLCC